MEESKIYIIPLPIFPSENCQTATATIKTAKTNLNFLLNILFFYGIQRYKNNSKYFNIMVCVSKK
jgi:hypothetical protein